MAHQPKAGIKSSGELTMTLDQLLEISGFDAKAAPRKDDFESAYDGVEGIEQSLLEILRRNSHLPELALSSEVDISPQWQVSTMEQFELQVQASETELALNAAGALGLGSVEHSGMKKSASIESLSKFFDFSDCADNVGIDNIMLGDLHFLDPLIDGHSLLDPCGSPKSQRRPGRANFTPKPFDTPYTGLDDFDFSYLPMFLTSSPKRFGGQIPLPMPMPVRTFVPTPTSNVAPVPLPVTVKVVEMRDEEKTSKSNNNRKRTRKENDSCQEPPPPSQDANLPPTNFDPKPSRKRRYTRKNKAEDKKNSEPVIEEPSDPLPEIIHNNDNFNIYPPFCPGGPAFPPMNNVAQYAPYPPVANEYRSAYPPMPHRGSGYMNMSIYGGPGNDNRNAYPPPLPMGPGGLNYLLNNSYPAPGSHNRAPYMCAPPNYVPNPDGRGPATESRTVIRNNLLASMNGRAAAAAAAVTRAGVVGGGPVRTHIYNPSVGAQRQPVYPYPVTPVERRPSNASSNTTNSVGSGLRRLAPRPIAPRAPWAI